MIEQIFILLALSGASFYLGVQHATKKANDAAMTRHSKLFAEIIMDVEKHMSVGCVTEFRKIRAAYLKRHGITEGVYNDTDR